MAAADPGLNPAAPGAAAAEPVPATPRLALLQHLARQSAFVLAPVFLSALTITAIAWREVPPAWALAWLVAVTTVLALRTVLLARLVRQTGLDETRRMRMAFGLSVLNGVVQGSAVAFAPWLSPVELTMVTIVQLFLAGGVVTTNLGHRPLMLAYLVPAMGPLALMWTRTGGLGLGVAAMIALFALILLGLGRRAWQQHEQALAARHEQLRLNEQLGAALALAEAASRAKTQFLAAASHDLRQPMHTLSLFGAALLMRPLDERSREIAQHMDGALRVLGSQLDALLDISRLDAGVVRAEALSFPLGGFLQRLCRDMQPAAQQRGLDFRLRIDDGRNVRTDPLLLERIVRNLLDNALKYTEAGSIGVTLQAVDEQQVELAIADTGRGIPAHEQERVFEEFYQLDNPGRDRARGLGLGLSIVRRLVRLLGIGFDLQSTPGHGTVVRLRLAVSAESLPVAAAPSRHDLLRGLELLVVDDDEAVRGAMAALLEGHGCRVRPAAGTAQALEIARQRRPDLVLADLRLQDHDDGIRCVQGLRALHPGLPALLISGDTAPERLRQAHDAGLRLLHKPVDAELLRKAILQVLP